MDYETCSFRERVGKKAFVFGAITMIPYVVLKLAFKRLFRSKKERAIWKTIERNVLERKQREISDEKWREKALPVLSEIIGDGKEAFDNFEFKKYYDKDLPTLETYRVVLEENGDFMYKRPNGEIIGEGLGIEYVAKDIIESILPKGRYQNQEIRDRAVGHIEKITGRNLNREVRDDAYSLSS